MNHWMWPVSLVGILSTAVVCVTDMFFLTIGRPALRLASCGQHQSRVRSGMVRHIRHNQFPLAKMFVCNRHPCNSRPFVGDKSHSTHGWRHST